MRGETLAIPTRISLVVEECYSCGVAFGLTEALRGTLIAEKKSFYCPNGHCQSYVGKTTAQKLDEAKREAAQLRAQLDQTDAALERERKKLAKLTRRIASGVCPECNRTFKALAKHMQSKHGSIQHSGAVQASGV